MHVDSRSKVINIGHFRESLAVDTDPKNKNIGTLASGTFVSTTPTGQLDELKSDFVKLEAISVDDRANFEQFMDETYFELVYSGAFDLFHVLFASDPNQKKLTISEKVKVAASIIKGELKNVEFYLKNVAGTAKSLGKEISSLKSPQTALATLNKWIGSVESLGNGAKFIWSKVVLARSKKEYVELSEQYQNGKDLSVEQRAELKEKMDKLKNFIAESEVDIENMQSTIVLKSLNGGIFVATKLFKGVLTVIDKTSKVGSGLSKGVAGLNVAGAVVSSVTDTYSAYKKYDEIRLHDKEVERMEKKFSGRVKTGKIEPFVGSVEGPLDAHLAKMKGEDASRLKKLEPEFNRMWDGMIAKMETSPLAKHGEIFEATFGIKLKTFTDEVSKEGLINKVEVKEKALKLYHNHLQTLQPITKQALERMSIKKHDMINRFLTVEMGIALAGAGLSIFGLTVGIIALVAFPPSALLVIGAGIFLAGVALILLGGFHAVLHRPNYAKEQYLKQGKFIKGQLLNFRKKVKTWEKARVESRKDRVIGRGTATKLEMNNLIMELEDTKEISEAQRKKLSAFIQISEETTAKDARDMLIEKERVFKSMLQKHVTQMANQMEKIDEEIGEFDRKVDVMAEKLVDASWTDYVGRWDEKGFEEGLNEMPPTVARLLKEGYISDELKGFYTETFELNIDDLSAQDKEKLKDSLQKEVKKHFGETTGAAIAGLKKKRKQERIAAKKMKLDFVDEGPDLEKKAA